MTWTEEQRRADVDNNRRSHEHGRGVFRINSSSVCWTRESSVIVLDPGCRLKGVFAGCVGPVDKSSVNILLAGRPEGYTLQKVMPRQCVAEKVGNFAQ